MRKFFRCAFDIFASDHFLLFLILVWLLPSFSKGDYQWWEKILFSVAYYGVVIGFLLSLFIKMRRFDKTIGVFFTFFLAVLLLFVLPLAFFNSLGIMLYLAIVLVVMILVLGATIYAIIRDIKRNHTGFKYGLRWALSLAVGIVIVTVTFFFYAGAFNSKFTTYYFYENPILSRGFTTFYYEGNSIFSYNASEAKSKIIKEDANEVSVEIDMSNKEGTTTKLEYVCQKAQGCKRVGE